MVKCYLKLGCIKLCINCLLANVFFFLHPVDLEVVALSHPAFLRLYIET